MRRIALVLATATTLLLAAADGSPEPATCKAAMTDQYVRQTAWWTPGHRPAECAGVDNEDFARLADEVTSS